MSVPSVVELTQAFEAAGYRLFFARPCFLVAERSEPGAPGHSRSVSCYRASTEQPWNASMIHRWVTGMLGHHEPLHASGTLRTISEFELWLGGANSMPLTQPIGPPEAA
jgi:hypothetical protein